MPILPLEMKRRIKTILRTIKKLPITWKYRLLKLFGHSDAKRWSKSSSFYESWDERTKKLVTVIPEKSRVLEFGAGRLVVEDVLPNSCEYFHSDIVKRREDTIVLDLNKELIILPEVDYIIFSGVLEYVKDVNNVLVHCTQFTQHILLSYAICDEFLTKRERRQNGWISDLYHQDLINIARNVDCDVVVLGEWNKQRLYQLSKVK